MCIYSMDRTLGECNDEERFLTFLHSWGVTDRSPNDPQLRLLPVVRQGQRGFLKLMGFDEAELTLIMSREGLAPPMYDCLVMDDGVCIVSEHMEGDLSSLLYPPKCLELIIPQVMDLIYNLYTKYRISHNDTKVNNFVWKQTPQGPEVYIIDFGMAVSFTETQLAENVITDIGLFNLSFNKPYEYGVRAPMEVCNVANQSEYRNWMIQLLTIEMEYIKKTPHLLVLFPEEEGVHFAYSHMLKQNQRLQ